MFIVPEGINFYIWNGYTVKAEEEKLESQLIRNDLYLPFWNRETIPIRNASELSNRQVARRTTP